MYLNEAEQAHCDIKDDFKLKKTVGFHGLYKNISALKPARLFFIQALDTETNNNGQINESDFKPRLCYNSLQEIEGSFFRSG